MLALLSFTEIRGGTGMSQVGDCYRRAAATSIEWWINKNLLPAILITSEVISWFQGIKFLNVRICGFSYTELRVCEFWTVCWAKEVICRSTLGSVCHGPVVSVSFCVFLVFVFGVFCSVRLLCFVVLLFPFWSFFFSLNCWHFIDKNNLHIKHDTNNILCSPYSNGDIIQSEQMSHI